MPDQPAEFHVHTALSWCAARAMSVASITAEAEQAGLSLVGLADHLWLDPKRGSRPSIDRLLTLREATSRPGPVKLLLGAEADCAPHAGLAGGESVKVLDYVIAAYHFTDVRHGATPAARTVEDLARLQLAGFRSLLQPPHVTIAGHPFYIPPTIFHNLPDDVQHHMREVFALVARGAGPLFAEAKAKGIAIELNAKALGPRHRDVLGPVILLAKEAGCRFVLSSDAHLPGEVGRSQSLLAYAASLGMTTTDFLSL